MNATLSEAAPTSVVSFRDARWKSKWLILGLAVLALWRSIGFLDPAWVMQWSPLLVFVAAALVQEAFLLIYPLVTRNPNQRATFAIPSPKRCLIELALAITVVIAAILALSAGYALIDRISPGSSDFSDPITGLARSANRTIVYGLLVGSFTLAPIAEEVFFRGFLYNAFKARMPTFVAALLQSLIFGFSHFHGIAPSLYLSLVGLLLTAVYEWRKTLVTPIFVHAGFNFIWAIGALFAMDVYANSPMMGVFGDQNDTECIIHQIVPDSAADEAGLQVGDTITSLNTEPIRDYLHLREVIVRYKPGDAVPVTVKRSGSEFEVVVTLRRRGDWSPTDDKAERR